eukprot:4211696-Prymnesium_polylepis.2
MPGAHRTRERRCVLRWRSCVLWLRSAFAFCVFAFAFCTRAQNANAVALWPRAVASAIARGPSAIGALAARSCERNCAWTERNCDAFCGNEKLKNRSFAGRLRAVTRAASRAAPSYIEHSAQWSGGPRTHRTWSWTCSDPVVGSFANANAEEP